MGYKKQTCEICKGTGINEWVEYGEKITIKCSRCRGTLISYGSCSSCGFYLNENGICQSGLCGKRDPDAPSFSSGSSSKKRIEYDDGSVYEGDLVNDEPHGKGKIKYSATDDDPEIIYEGDFINGEPYGKGKKTWLDNGDKYEGDFVRGLQQGKGKMTWADGRVYSGDYHENQRNGKGKMTYPNGKVEEGRWKDNKFVG